MDEHNLDRHLKAYCDMHEEYQRPICMQLGPKSKKLF